MTILEETISIFERHHELDGQNREVILEALREKAERSKGCMRCNHGKGFYTGAAWIFIGEDGSLSITTSKDNIVDFPANTITHCPWCGKPLKGGE